MTTAGPMTREEMEDTIASVLCDYTYTVPGAPTEETEGTDHA